MSNDITSRFFHWMDSNNITRTTAAKALGVDERSLSTYRSRGLPRKKGARAEQIMREHKAATAPAADASSNQISVVFNNDDFEIVEKAAQLTRCTTKEFIQKATCTAARKEIDEDRDQGEDTTPPFELAAVADVEATYRTQREKHS